jgi:hypothetical protein
MLSHEWYWGTNFAYEAELGGEFEHELGFSAGIAKLFDGKFSIGGEVRGEAELEKEGAELEAEELSAMAGPSFHVRLPGGMRLSLVPTAGIKYSDTSRAAYEVFLSFGRDN